jgi:hypothetical protein
MLILTLCCLVTATFAQSRRQSATNRGIVLEISVVQTNGANAEELDRIEKNKDQLKRLIGEQKLRVIASLQVRSRVGESFTARTGQQVPIQTAMLPVYRPIEGATSDRRDSRSQVLQGTGTGLPQIEYKSPGLTVEGSLTKASDNLLDLNLKVELAGMDRSTGTLTPTFTQLSCAGAVRMKESETAVLMNALQPDNRQKSIEEIAAGTEDKAARSSLIVIITTRPVR